MYNFFKIIKPILSLLYDQPYLLQGYLILLHTNSIVCGTNQ